MDTKLASPFVFLRVFVVKAANKYHEDTKTRRNAKKLSVIW